MSNQMFLGMGNHFGPGASDQPQGQENLKGYKCYKPGIESCLFFMVTVSDLHGCALEKVTSRDKCVLSSTVEDTSTFRSSYRNGLNKES